MKKDEESPHIGSSLDDFLSQERIKGHCEKIAALRLKSIKRGLEECKEGKLAHIDPKEFE